MRKDPGSPNGLSQGWPPIGRRSSSHPGFELLSALSHLVTSSPPTPELLTRALELIALHIPVTACTITRLVPDLEKSSSGPISARALALTRYATYQRLPFDSPEQLPLTCDLLCAPWHQRAIDSAQTIILRQDEINQRMDVNELAILGWSDPSSACLIPLIAESRTLGVLGALEKRLWERAPFTPEMVNLLELAGTQIAAALVRIEYEENAQRRADEARALTEISRIADIATNAVQVRQHLIEQVARVLGAPRAMYYSYDAQLSRATLTNEFQMEPPAAGSSASEVAKTLDLRNAPETLQMLLSGQYVTMRADNRSGDFWTRDLLNQNGGVALVAYPIKITGRLVGILMLWEHRVGYDWSDEKIRLAERLVAVATGALQSAELVAREQRREQELELLARVSNRAAKLVSVDDLAHLAIEQICGHFDCEDVALFLKQAESDSVTCWAGSAEVLPRLVMVGRRVSLNSDDWIHRVMSTGQTLCGVESSPGAKAERAVVAVPLKVGGETVGALQVHSRSVSALDPLDLATLETLAAQLAAALASAHAQEVMRGHTGSLQTLQRLSREVTASLDVDEVCQAIYRGTRELMDCDVFFIALYDEQSQMCDYTFRVDEGVILPPRRTPLGDGMTGHVIRSRSSIIVTDAAEEKRFKVYHWGGHRASKSLLCVPMEIGDHILGALSVQSYRTGAYDLADLYIFSAFAGQAAVAINNARLFTSSQRRMRQLSVLNEVGRIVSSTIEIDRLLELIYDQVRRILRADSYYVALSNPADQTMTIELLVDEGERFPPRQLPPGSGLVNMVVQRRAPLLLRNFKEELPALDVVPFQIGHPHTSESWLGVPMITSEHMVGVLAVGSYQSAAFDEDDQEILQNVATQAAIAVDNARHHAEVEEQARRDSLTQVFNHGYFLVSLRDQVQRAVERSSALSLIMLDIDFFKDYNDRFGHLTGDVVLRGTVQAIRDNIKRTDLVGRWGGEEFVIALPGSDRQGARIVAERIRQTLAGMIIQDDQGRRVPVPTVSQGVATLPEDTQEAIALVDLADKRLYVAKERGRDQVEG